MNALILAHGIGGIGLGQLALLIIVFGAMCAIVFVALKAMGVAMPQWLWQILVIIAVAVVAIVAIRFIMTL